jgi:hypothetical protein
LRAPLRYVALFIVAAVIALPVAVIGGMAMTPLLWRLEPIVGLELAGHSGPSDWILETLFGVIALVVFIVIVRAARRRSRES